MCHVSTKEALWDILEAKRRGVNVTFEVTPHHIWFCHNEFRVNPPIREEEDVNELIQAMLEDKVDAIATDHAPHSPEDKAKGAPGCVGLETAFSVCYTKLCREHGMKLETLSRMMSKTPAEVLGVKKGLFEAGYDGDAVLVDTEETYTVDPDDFEDEDDDIINVAVIGKPNAGKSSLINRIAGEERSIVSDIAGTTRDAVDTRIEKDGVKYNFIDTAGLREGGDVIERIGMERSRESLRTAEVVFWVLDAAADPQAEAAEMAAAAPPCTVAVWNKMDVAPEVGLPQVAFPTVRISAVTGAGLEELADTFAAMVWQEKDWREPEIAVNARHQEQLHRASTVLPEAAKLINAGEWELAAIPLRAAIEAIGRITGETTDPDVLENIFSRFCIGK